MQWPWALELWLSDTVMVLVRPVRWRPRGWEWNAFPQGCENDDFFFYLRHNNVESRMAR